MTAAAAVEPRRESPTGLLGIALLRSEWTKIRSVRSTYWSLVAAAAAVIGLGAIFCASYISRYDRLPAEARATFDPTAFSLNGIFLAQLAIGVLGVLVITSEYSSGMIRTTLSAVPQRRAVLLAKATVFAATAFVVGTIASIGGFLIGQAILSQRGIQASLDQPEVVRAILGGGLYLAVLGLLAMAIGALLRHSAGAIATVFGVILVIPGLVRLLPSPWNDDISKYLPAQAGQEIFHTVSNPNALSSWAGFAVFSGYAALALMAALVVINRRDA